MGRNKLNSNKKNFISDRLILLAGIFVCMYIVLILKFYKLQIIDHESYEEDLRASVERTVEVPAVRGIIYDRYGKPLATNKPIYVLKVDAQVDMKKDTLNEILLSVANLLEANNDTYIDNVPITKTEPFTFTGDESTKRSFITNYLPYDDQEHKEILYGYSAEQLMDYMRNDVFAISKTISNEDARKIIAMRLEMYQTAYQKYKKITIAENISSETLAAIEENKEKYPSIMAEVESQRYYVYGKEFGNVLGYTRKITASQYETMKEQGYDQDDVIGQGGVESTMEQELRGEKGKKVIEVDNMGREVFTLEEADNKDGNDVYLTIDADLQLAAYNAIEQQLSAAIVQRLRGQGRGVMPLTGREVIVSMVDNNQLVLSDMQKAPQEQMQKQLYDKVNADYEKTLAALEIAEKNLPDEEKTKLTLKQHFSNMINAEDSTITNRELLLALSEQGSLQLSDTLVQQIWSGSYPSLESILIQEYEAGRLKPDQAAIAPYSGSAAVVDVNTGETLAVVGYPSYDSNQMTQNFNRYYTMFHDGVDSRDMLWNRATRTTMAPGSTFKMISAIAGLEEGVITKDTIINDTGVYTRAGQPYPKCWIFTNSGYGHGAVDVEHALEVSCNYFFFDVAYRLGLKYGMPYGGIDALTKYVEMFGLDKKTNIELEEESPNVSTPGNLVQTYTSRALNNLRRLDENGKKSLYEDVVTYVETGFYPYSNTKSGDTEAKIDYLVQYDLKKSLDTELSKVLGSDLSNIYNRLLGDVEESLKDTITPQVKEVVDNVLADTSDQSLKLKTKNEISDILLGVVSENTHRAILKTVKKMPQQLVSEAYLTAYENALSNLTADEQSLKPELESRIAAIKAGNFDAYNLIADKIETRIFNVYLNNYFENIQMEWTTAITIRTAIGQGNNAYTPIQVARYIAGLANGKEVYDLSVIAGIYDNKDSQLYEENPPKVYNELNIADSTLDSVYKGMKRVVDDTSGTASSVFADFPIDIGAKTGTAQQGQYEHSWFVGFAPYDNPEIAIVTSMYGANGLGSHNTKLARSVLEAYFDIETDSEKTQGSNIGTHLVE